MQQQKMSTSSSAYFKYIVAFVLKRCHDNNGGALTPNKERKKTSVLALNRKECDLNKSFFFSRGT